jgi:alanine dehydrogenase
MPIFLDEKAVCSLVTMQDALEAVEELFRAQGEGGVTNVPRVRAPMHGGTLRITAGILSYRGYYGIKISSNAVTSQDAGRMFCLYREKTASLCAVMQVYGMGALRTGAASGVATKYLANDNAAGLGVIGTGPQARTQVRAVCGVRPIREVKVYSSTAENRQRFGREVETSLAVKAMAVDSAEAAVRGSDIVITATSSRTPVLHGKWLSPGTHINAIGANYEARRELDRDVVAAASVIAADDREQVQYESTDLADPVKAGIITWDRVLSLGDIVAGRAHGRAAASDITLFKSLGVAMEDVALAARVYERAVERKIGQQLPDLDGMGGW